MKIKTNKIREMTLAVTGSHCNQMEESEKQKKNKCQDGDET